jgi:predicted phosphodiesterase
MSGRDAFKLIAPLFSLFLFACAASQPVSDPAPESFQHDFSEGQNPWTKQAFDNGKEKFTFAVFSDLTGGEREGVFKVAIEQLRLLRPELIVSVGDLIEGGTTDREQLAREWDSFDQRAERARAPVYYTGGNHDLTNPVMWEVFEERYGKRYYHFVYKNTLFLVLNTEDNTPQEQWELKKNRDEAMQAIADEGWGIFKETDYGKSPLRGYGNVGDEQAAYFREVIARYPDVLHTFVIMHKPTWEQEGEVNFATLENALSDRPYTVFYGHEHDYQYDRRLGRDYICLGTTGGVQNKSKDMAIDHVTLVTVSKSGVDIANLRMSGIFGKDGSLPLNGDDMCFAARECEAPD